jgi:hypothetical protein
MPPATGYGRIQHLNMKKAKHPHMYYCILFIVELQYEMFVPFHEKRRKGQSNHMRLPRIKNKKIRIKINNCMATATFTGRSPRHTHASETTISGNK